MVPEDQLFSSISAMNYGKSQLVLKFLAHSVFKDVALDGRDVLDIGGGNGFLSFYAALRGAKAVTCLEPEAAGSTSGVRERFEGLKSKLKIDNVILAETTFQELDAESHSFDIILLQNSINHLDEKACIEFKKAESARRSYHEIFSKLAAVSRHGATLIICDCSPNNAFAFLGLTNPFSGTIEWHKHQTPKTWALALAACGFVNPRVNWSTPTRLGKWGKKIMGNKLGAFFWTSHFRLVMNKVDKCG